MMTDENRYARLLSAILITYSLTGPNLFASANWDRVVSTNSSTNIYQLTIIIIIFTLTARIFAKSKNIQFNVEDNIYGLLLLWGLLTSINSTYPIDSLRRLFNVALIGFATILIIKENGINHTYNMLRKVGVLVLFASYAYVIAGIGIHTTSDAGGTLAGDWKGIFPHKNPAATFFLPLSALLIHQARQNPKAWHYFSATACIFFLYKTGSKTSIYTATLMYGTYLLMEWSTEKARKLIVCIFIGLGLVGLYAILFKHQNIIDSIEPTEFTGRGYIWKVVEPYISESFWTGHGYGAFWGLGHNSKLVGADDSFVVALGQGHNGYLDLLITIGAPGLILGMLCTYLLPLFQMLRNGQTYPLLASILIGGALTNTTESMYFSPDFPGWIFIVITSLSVGQKNQIKQ